MKRLKLTILKIFKLLGGFALIRYLTRNQVRILCYHGVWLGDEGYPGDAMFMKLTTFESRLECLRRWRFTVIPLDQAMAGLYDDRLPPCPVVITIDDGWYSTYAAMLPALRFKGMPATLYCDTAHLLSCKPVPHVMALYFKILAEAGYCGTESLTDVNHLPSYEVAIKPHGDTMERLAAVSQFAQAVSIDFDKYTKRKVFSYMLPEQLAEAYHAGLDVQLHTHNHSMQDLSPAAVTKELEENRRHLADILGVEPEHFSHFCYPSGAYAPGLESVLEGLGIRSSTTTKPGIVHPGSNRQLLPRILDGEQMTILELEAELCGVIELLRTVRRIFT